MQLLVGWPLVLLPLLIFSQIVTPHPVWVVLLVVLVALYLGRVPVGAHAGADGDV